MHIGRLHDFELRQPQPRNGLRLILAYLLIAFLTVSGLVLLNKQAGRPPDSESPAFFGP